MSKGSFPEVKVERWSCEPELVCGIKEDLKLWGEKERKKIESLQIIQAPDHPTSLSDDSF